VQAPAILIFGEISAAVFAVPLAHAPMVPEPTEQPLPRTPCRDPMNVVGTRSRATLTYRATRVLRGTNTPRTRDIPGAFMPTRRPSPYLERTPSTGTATDACRDAARSPQTNRLDLGPRAATPSPTPDQLGGRRCRLSPLPHGCSPTSLIRLIRHGCHHVEVERTTSSRPGPSAHRLGYKENDPLASPPPGRQYLHIHRTTPTRPHTSECVRRAHTVAPWRTRVVVQPRGSQPMRLSM